MKNKARFKTYYSLIPHTNIQTITFCTNLFTKKSKKELYLGDNSEYFRQPFR